VLLLSWVWRSGRNLAACRLCNPATSRADAYAAAVLTDEPAAYFRLTETNDAYYSGVNAFTGTGRTGTRASRLQARCSNLNCT
jgi:hypothetical protein